jgi:formate dehydrogenase major subunit
VAALVAGRTFAWPDGEQILYADGAFATAEGVARLFAAPYATPVRVAAVCRDGPLPEHYEPVESPVANKLSRRQFNPAATISGKGTFGDRADVGDAKFPYVATTYRVTEHWQSGAMTRSVPWLGEMMPDMFVEISESLAAKIGVKSGDRVTVTTIRGELTAPAMVSPRVRPILVHGKETEVVGLPWHWGYKGMYTGMSANLLTPHIGDANTQIPEYKAFLCDVKKAGGAGPVRR